MTSFFKGLHTIGKGVGIVDKFCGALFEKDFNIARRTWPLFKIISILKKNQASKTWAWWGSTLSTWTKDLNTIEKPCGTLLESDLSIPLARFDHYLKSLQS